MPKLFANAEQYKLLLKSFNQVMWTCQLKKIINRCSLPSALENVRIDDFLLFFSKYKTEIFNECFFFSPVSDGTVSALKFLLC